MGKIKYTVIKKELENVLVYFLFKCLQFKFTVPLKLREML